jgi:hypothetical protein
MSAPARQPAAEMRSPSPGEEAVLKGGGRQTSQSPTATACLVGIDLSCLVAKAALIPYDEEIVHNERLPDEEAWLSFGVAVDGVLQDALLKETHQCRRR